ncbi:NAD(P)-binding domain-containing protein [Streptomyces aureoversilis]|uniref:NAD(P)-binding domain-containing protein n=1 Tax=Streptomyces aureoversilis TaxID=67277 RepID=A0ABW0ACA1_9ACTN
MDQLVVGILHPGSMDAAVAACATTNAAADLWCAEGRSPASAARAEQFGLELVPTLQELLEQSDIVISLCPPAAAESLARKVATCRFDGVYVEANAINAERTVRIADVLATTAATVVDGGVVGSPPAGGKTPTLYLSGPVGAAVYVEAVFAGTAVRTKAWVPRSGRHPR